MKKNQIKIQYYKSPIGEILLGSYDNKLCIADWRYRKMRMTIDNRIQKGLKAEYVEESSEVVTQWCFSGLCRWIGCEEEVVGD